MEKAVVELIRDIIGNGKPCSKEDWSTISKALAEALKPSHNKSSFQFPNIVEVINYCSDDNEGVSLGKYDISLINKVYNFMAGNKKR